MEGQCHPHLIHMYGPMRQDLAVANEPFAPILPSLYKRCVSAGYPSDNTTQIPIESFPKTRVCAIREHTNVPFKWRFKSSSFKDDAPSLSRWVAVQVSRRSNPIVKLKPEVLKDKKIAIKHRNIFTLEYFEWKNFITVRTGWKQSASFLNINSECDQILPQICGQFANRYD